MPSKPPRICACRFRVPHGQLCPCQQQRKAAADRDRESAYQRGYDGDWRKLRAEHLRRHPSCVLCSKPANTVDHIKRVRDFPELRLDPRNIQSMCRSCHSKRRQRQERAAEGSGRQFRPTPLRPARGGVRGTSPNSAPKTEVEI